MLATISTRRARRIMSSFSGPGASSLACSRKRVASSARRMSGLSVFAKHQRFIWILLETARTSELSSPDTPASLKLGRRTALDWLPIESPSVMQTSQRYRTAGAGRLRRINQWHAAGGKHGGQHRPLIKSGTIVPDCGANRETKRNDQSASQNDQLDRRKSPEMWPRFDKFTRRNGELMRGSEGLGIHFMRSFVKWRERSRRSMQIIRKRKAVVEAVR